MPVASDNYREYFRTHHPELPKQKRLDTIAAYATDLAEMILSETPGGDDQRESLRSLRQCVMFAKDAIIMEGIV